MFRLLGIRIPRVVGVPLGLAVMVAGLVIGRPLLFIAGGLVLVTSAVSATGGIGDDTDRRR